MTKSESSCSTRPLMHIGDTQDMTFLKVVVMEVLLGNKG